MPAQTANVNDFFFDGIYKELWRKIIPDGLTKAETDFIVEKGRLKPGSKVIDFMCGYGRHTLALARQGIHVTAVDNLPAYIKEVSETVKKENLPVESVMSDVLEINFPLENDLAICMGNSLCFFDKTDTEKILSKTASSLKNDGILIINSWTLAETVYTNFKERSWSYTGDVKHLAESKFNFHPTNIETENIFIMPDGKTEIKKSVDYIYSLSEMEAMLNTAGLILNETWSIPGKKKFTLGEPRAYLVAQRK